MPAHLEVLQGGRLSPRDMLAQERIEKEIYEDLLLAQQRFKASRKTVRPALKKWL